LLCYSFLSFLLNRLNDGANMFQPGFFDLDKRMRKIDSNGDPLTKIDQVVDWEFFHPAIEKARQKPRKSPAGLIFSFFGTA